MLELGADSRTEHDAIVALVKELKIEAHFVGPEFQRSTLERCYPNTAALLGILKNEPLTGHLVLVKGSRGIRLETLLEAL
jgi:UDP-N-acetylmuramyl pentapeptide synthase